MIHQPNLAFVTKKGNLMSHVKILAFAGSLRSGSYNKQLVQFAAERARQAGAEVTLIDLRDYALPIYDADLEEEHGLPENGRLLKDLFRQHDGLIVGCPEYNSSITAVLKNTIDWVSRPSSRAVIWKGLARKSLFC